MMTRPVVACVNAPFELINHSQLDQLKINVCEKVKGVFYESFCNTDKANHV